MATPEPVKRDVRVRHFDLIGWVYQQTDGSVSQRSVLNVLAIAANEAGFCWLSVRTICERTGCGRSTVLEAVAHWRSLGVLSTEPRTYKGQRKVMANEYHLNPDRFPEEAFEETRPEAGPVQDVDPTRPEAGPPIGIAIEHPTSLRSVSRPKRRESEERERGTWSEEMSPTPVADKPPAKKRARRPPRPPTPGQVLANHFKDRCDEVVPAGGTQVGGLSKMFTRALEAKVDEVILVESIDMFFDGGHLQTGRGTAPPWLQYVNKVYMLTQLLNERAKRGRPRGRTSTTYGAMPQHIIEETARGVRTD